MKIEEKFVETKFGKVVYEEWGTGDKLVIFFHGFMENPMHVGLLAPTLAKQGYRVVAPYLPGYGRTFDLPEGFNFNDLAEVIREFIEKLSAGKKVVLIGHSMGGALAWEIACRKPEIISKVVLLDPGLNLTKINIWGRLVRWIKNLIIDRKQFKTKTGMFLFPSYCFKLDKLYLLFRHISLVRSINVSDHFPKEISARVLWGTDDGITPLKENKDKLKVLSKLDLTLFAGGHNWFHWQEKDYIEAVEKFL